MGWIGPVISLVGGLIGNSTNQNSASDYAQHGQYTPGSTSGMFGGSFGNLGSSYYTPSTLGQATTGIGTGLMGTGALGLGTLGGVQGYGNVSPQLYGQQLANQQVQSNLPSPYMPGQAGQFSGLTNQFGGLASQGLSSGLPPAMRAYGQVTGGANPGTVGGGYLGAAGAGLLGGGGPNTGAPTWQGNYNNMLGALQQQAAPGQNLQEMNLLNSLQNSGNIGSTAGQYQQQGLQTALQSQNAGYQAMAMQNANTLAQQNVLNQQANLGLGINAMQGGGYLGLQGQGQQFAQGQGAAGQQQAFNQAYFQNAMNAAQGYSNFQGTGFGQNLTANQTAAQRAQQMFSNYAGLFGTGTGLSQNMLSSGMGILGNLNTSEIQQQQLGAQMGGMQSAANLAAWQPLLGQQLQLGNGIAGFGNYLGSQYQQSQTPSLYANTSGPGYIQQGGYIIPTGQMQQMPPSDTLDSGAPG